MRSPVEKEALERYPDSPEPPLRAIDAALRSGFITGRTITHSQAVKAAESHFPGMWSNLSMSDRQERTDQMKSTLRAIGLSVDADPQIIPHSEAERLAENYYAATQLGLSQPDRWEHLTEASRDIYLKRIKYALLHSGFDVERGPH